MHQSDWILRQIELAGVLLKRIVAALREHRPDDVLELSHEAIGVILDLDATLADTLTGEALVSLLSAGGVLDSERAAMLGEVLAARAAAYSEAGRQESARAEADRATQLLDAVEVDVIQADAETYLLDRVDAARGFLSEAGL